MPARYRRIGREALVFAAYLVLAIAFTWPLARTLNTSVSDLGDPLLNTWILDWSSYALTHQPLHLFDAPMYVPSVHPLAFSEHLVGIALVTLPFHLAGTPPVALYNVAMILGFALSGYAAFVLARMFTRSFAAAFIAGIFFGFVSFKFDHLAHLQIVFGSTWIAFILAALVAWWRRPDWKRALLFCAAFVMNGLTNIYFLLFAAAAVGLSLLFLFFAGEKRELKAWLRIGVALLVAGVILFPFLQPYRTVSKLYQMKRPPEEVLAGSGDWADWMRASGRSRIYGGMISDEKHRHEHELFPGLFALTMLAAAIVMVQRERTSFTAHAANVSRRTLRTLDILIVILFLATIVGTLAEPRFTLRAFGRMLVAIRGSDLPMMTMLVLILARLSLRMPEALGGAEGKTLRDVLARSRFSIETWMAMLWMVIGIFGSFGLRTFFYSFLFQRIEAYQSMRSPGRWAVITYAGLAVWMALGVAAILAARVARVPRSSSGSSEETSDAQPSTPRNSEEPRGTRGTKALASLLAVLCIIDLLPSVRWEQVVSANAPVYEWIDRNEVGPVLEWPVDPWLVFRYLLGSAHHRVPLMNGTSGFEPPVHRSLREAWEQKRYADVLDIAERNGCRIIVVHRHWFHESDPAQLVSVLRSALDTGRVQFLGRFDHDVEGDFAFAVTRNFPDWQRLRAPEIPNGAGHLPSHTLARFLKHQPTYSTSAIARLDSPAMLETVTGPLQISGWAASPHGIKKVYVLLDEGSIRLEAQRTPREDITRAFHWYYEGMPAFSLRLEKRPRGVPVETDVQIEVVDGRGNRTKLEDRLISWKDPE